MKPNVISSTDSFKKCTMYSKSDSSIVMVGNDMEEIIQEHYDSLLHKYQIVLEQPTKSSNLIFDYISGIHYVCQKTTMRIIYKFC